MLNDHDCQVGKRQFLSAAIRVAGAFTMPAYLMPALKAITPNRRIGSPLQNSSHINAPLKWPLEKRAKFIEDTKVYVTSAFWSDSKDAAKRHKDRYDAVCVPGVYIKGDGTIGRNPKMRECLVSGKPLLYIIQNHPEKDKWRPELASAFMKLDDIQLRDELAQFEEGIILDLENMTPKMNKNYHTFVERVRKAYDGPLIVSTHAKLRQGGEVYGLGKEMNYKVIIENADAVNYMTLAAWPVNPEYPIADLSFYKRTLDTLFEQGGIKREKLIASIPTYIKVSYLDQRGKYIKPEIRDRININAPEAGPAKEMLSKLGKLDFESEEEGRFTTKYNGRKVRGWMMTEPAFQARIDLLREKGIDKVALWYGGQFLEDTEHLRDIVHANSLANSIKGATQLLDSVLHLRQS